MSGFNFPPNPSPGDTWTVGTTTYVWNGSAWLVQSSTRTSAFSTLTVYDTIYAGRVIVTSTEEINTSTSINGALQVYGGAWIDKSLYVGGVLYASGGQVLTTASFQGTVQGGVDIQVVTSTGTDSTTILTWNNISTLQSVTGRGATTTRQISFLNTSESVSTITGAIVVTGGIGVGKRVTCESLRIADSVFDSTQTLVNTTDATQIDSYSTSSFRSAKYLVQIDDGTGANADFELRELLLVRDNQDRVFATEYGVVTSGGRLGEFAAESTAGNVVLYFTAFNTSSKIIKVLRTGMAA